MKITDVEAIVVRQPSLDGAIADGSQDDLIVRVRTDEGIEGIGEVDSSPEVVRAVVYAPTSHSLTGGLRDLLIGEDPLDIERLWQKMYRGTIFLGRRGVAIHAISGIDIALWDIKGKALGKPVSELIGAPRCDKVRAYASLLMPDTTSEVRERVTEMCERGFTAVKLGWGPLGQSPANDLRLAAAACDAAGGRVAIMIDAGFAYGGAPRRRSPWPASSRTWVSTGSRSRWSRTSSTPTPSSPMRSSSGLRQASRMPRSGAFAT